MAKKAPISQQEPTPISHELRKLILASKLSRYAIAQAAGVDQAILTRFVRGTRPNISSATMHKLAEAIGYELTLKPRS